ncbi:MAG: YciC family protein, partial [Edwardsiella piscicida]
MPITARSLYRDSVNFFRHQVTPIVLLALLTAFISVMLNQALSPSAQAISQLSSGDGVSAARGLQEMIRQMTPEQQMTLLKVSAASSFSVLIGNVLLLGGMLTLIPQASTGARLSALRAIGLSAPMLPRLLLLMLLCTLMVQLG